MSPPCTRAGQAGRRRWQEAPGAALSGLLQESRKAAHACMGCFRQPAPSPQEPGGPGPFVPAAPTPSSPSRHTTSLQTQAALGAPTDEALGHTAAPPGSRPLCPPPQGQASGQCTLSPRKASATAETPWDRPGPAACPQPPFHPQTLGLETRQGMRRGVLPEPSKPCPLMLKGFVTSCLPSKSVTGSKWRPDGTWHILSRNAPA